MGGSRPSPPTVIMPPQTAPEKYQSLIPQESFQDLAESMNRIETETAKIQQQRYDELGTPADRGARSAGTNMLAAAAYLSSLPGSDPDTNFQATQRPFDLVSTADSAKTKVGQVSQAAGVSTQKPTGTKTKTKIEQVRDAAVQNLAKSKKDYAAAIELAKKTPRPKGTITQNPSFANRPDSTYLPKQLDPETGKMKKV
jgi:hypothetical protein